MVIKAAYSMINKEINCLKTIHLFSSYMGSNKALQTCWLLQIDLIKTLSRVRGCPPVYKEVRSFTRKTNVKLYQLYQSDIFQRPFSNLDRKRRCLESSGISSQVCLGIRVGYVPDTYQTSKTETNILGFNYVILSCNYVILGFNYVNLGCNYVILG